MNFLAITFVGSPPLCSIPKNEYNTPGYCEEGQIACHGGFDVKVFDGEKYGCKRDDICYTKPPQCPSFYCPTYCLPEAGYHFCPTGVDVKGCPMGPGGCTWRSEHETCPLVCRPRCDWEGGHTLCPHGEDSNGCDLGHHCALACGKNKKMGIFLLDKKGSSSIRPLYWLL